MQWAPVTNPYLKNGGFTITIRVENISCKYPFSQKLALENVQAEFLNHTITLVLGSSGSGKSTLFSALSGLLPLETGHVQIEHEPLWVGNKINRKALIRLGYSFQLPEDQLFAETVNKELRFSLKHSQIPKNRWSDKIEYELNAYKLSAKWLSDSPLTMSGGQKRRLALATTTISEPDWLILDEPIAGLDPMMLSELLTYLESWKNNHESGGVIISTHDLEPFLPLADNLYLINQGVISPRVPIGQLYENPSILDQADLERPTSLRLHGELKKLGIPMENRYYSAKECAILTSKYGISPNQKALSLGLSFPEWSIKHKDDIANVHEIETQITYPMVSQDSVIKNNSTSFFFRADPRVKWIASIFLSLVTLLEMNWQGTLTSAFIATFALVIAKLPWHNTWKVLRPFLWFAVVSMVFSLWSWKSSGHGASQSSMLTFQSLIRWGAALMFGYIFTATTTHLEIRTAMNQLLSPLKKLHLPIDTLSLSTALLFKMTKVLSQILTRFVRITESRGKRGYHHRGLYASDVPAIFIPFFLAVLQYGENLAISLDLRGSYMWNQINAYHKTKKLDASDKSFLMISLGLCAILVLLRIN